MTLLKLKPVFIAVLFLAASRFSFAQIREEKTNFHGNIRYNEELYIRTDRDIYIVGESVFLKIFKINGGTHSPGNISKVVYIELLDSFNNPVSQQKVYVDDFSGSAALRLPESLSTGNYLIRSCTNWMQNFSSDLFSYKRISVINPFSDIDKINFPVPAQQPDSIAFYPEGGSLVSGVETRVGYRCFNFKNEPVIIKGIIIDSENDTLCRIQTNVNGYGFFSVRTEGNRKVYLVTGENKASEKRFPLPVVRETGVVLSVNTNNDQDCFRIDIQKSDRLNSSIKNYTLGYNPVTVPPVKKEITLENSETVILQKSDLPYGLALIELTDNTGKSIARRWVFNKKHPDLKYNIQLNNQTVYTREKIRVDISAKDQSGNPVKSDMMISVVKSFSLDRTNNCNFPGYLQLPLLATMVTDSESCDINESLIFYKNEGNLLESDNVKPAGISDYLPELKGHLVSGIIKDASTGKPLEKEDIVLSIVGEKAKCSFTKTDEYGNFNFIINDFGTREVVIQPLSPALNNCNVELRNPFPEVSGRYKPVPFYPDSNRLAEINKAVISAQVKNIYGSYQVRPATGTIFNENDFYGEPDDTILINRFIELNSLKEIIKEIVPWVSIYERGGKSKFRIINGPLSLPFNSDPLMLVDGVPVKDLDLILTIDPKEMDRIEILRERYLISDIVLEGIIHFITKKHNLSLLGFDNPVFRQEFQALQPAYFPYWPDYSDDNLKNNHIPDFRNTLYWNADVNTGDSGNATVEFYTSDEPGEYTIIVEGMTSDGRSCRSESRLFVKNRNNQ